MSTLVSGANATRTLGMLAIVALAVSCASDSGDGNGGGGSGATPDTSSATGGGVGAPGSGASAASGGVSGGNGGTGGGSGYLESNGGTLPAGGSAATGGAIGGSMATGGSIPIGGSTATGGTSAVGGSAAVGGTAGTGGTDPTQPVVDPAKVIVVVFIIDGLQSVTAATAAANGAANLQMVFEQGVTVDEAFCVSPSPRLELPDGSRPWGGTSPPNVAIHTGCHVYDSRQMDDIFFAARDSGIKSVYVGGDKNYAAFDTADYHYAGKFSDQETVARAVQHFKDDGVRLLRLHLQRIRDDWNGPDGRTDPSSEYVQAVINADRQLGVLIDALKSANAWENTYLIVSSDHGMGQSGKSSHPAGDRSSWEIFMGFYGPGIKQGETIPYAESPDMALLTVHLLGARSLQGHTDPDVTIDPKGTTGTLLTNIFAGSPSTLEHPQLIRNYLESENYSPPGDFVHYRANMLEQLAK